jgi:protein-S-isoprenylcysteine O-methyltransferase Ste14
LGDCRKEADVGTFATHYRKPLTFLAAGGILAFHVLTHTRWELNSWPTFGCWLGGAVLLTVALLGRLWTASYNKGYRGRKLLTVGPYSIVRHPLYLFSMIGTIALGLISLNVYLLAVLVIAYVLYYPLVMRGEEGHLRQQFGEEFEVYRKSVPAVIPKLSLYQEPDTWEMRPRKYRSAYMDAFGFVLVALLVWVVVWLHSVGVLPYFWQLP